MATGPPGITRSTVLEAIAARASRERDRTAFEFVGDEGVVSGLTFSELEGVVSALAARLAAVVPRGGRAVILYPPGLEYIVALLATMAAGVAAVPAYPPTSPRHLGRLRALLGSCGADAVLAAEFFGDLEAQLAPADRPVPWLLGTAGALGFEGPTPSADDVALIQYTSGSTSAPRGVVLTHRQIVSNLDMITAAFRLTADDRSVLWLPPYHDMGLIGGILAPLWVGFRVRLMSPLSFIRDPLGWLEQISMFEATVAGGPNFGFERCVRRLAREPRRALRLDSWSLAFTGAEPIRAATLARFAAAFAPYGFRERALAPCYGLAEVTLMATGAGRGAGARVRSFSRAGLAAGRVSAAADPRDAQALVSCGRPVPGMALRIADAEGRPLESGRVGEIRLAGANVAVGYLGDPGGVSGTCFDGREVATRDLGFLDEAGELYVCGRASELLIVRGRNVHPEDVELVVEEELPQPGPAIAFGIDVDGEERLVILREARGLDPASAGAAAARIRARVGEVVGVQPAEVVFVAAGELPRTSSGKVRRGEARVRFEAGEFTPLAGVTAIEDAATDGDPVALALRDCVAHVLGVPAAVIALGESPTAAGLDSMGAMAVAEALEDRHGLTVSPADLVAGTALEAVAARARPRAGPDDEAAPGERDDDDAVEASYGERALWLHERLGTGPSPYVLGVALRLGGGVDRAALELALADLVERCAALRTTWTTEDGVLLRRVHARVPVTLHTAPGLDLAAATRPRLAPERPGGCLRATLFEDGSVLHLAVHHLAADHWALRLLVSDLAECYGASVNGTVAPPPRTTGTAALRREEAELLSSPAGEALLGAQVEALADAPSSEPRPRPAELDFSAATITVALRPRTAELLSALASTERTTPFVVIAAALHALLARLSGRTDVVIGTPIARRDTPARRRVAGLVMNTVPLRLDARGSFRALIRAEHALLADARVAAEIPFARLVGALGLSGERAPLYTTLLTALESPRSTSSWEVIELAQPGVAVDAAFDAHFGPAGISLTLRYAQQAFDRESAERLARRFAALLEQCVAVPDRPIASATLTDPRERRRLLALAGAAHARPGADVFARFAAHAVRSPDAPALDGPEGALSYADVLHQACALAAELPPAGAVGVLLPRGQALVTTVLAALAARVPWVPLDPDAPNARVEAMLRAAGARVLITDRAVPVPEGVVVRSPAARSAPLDPRPANGRELAYVMFTSGSTGQPKGVLVERGSLSAVLNAFAALEPVAKRRRMLAATSLGFDISVLELLLPLVMGATAVLAGRDGMRDAAGLIQLIDTAAIDLIQGTPSTLAVLLDAGLHVRGTTVLCGGEPAPPGLFTRLRVAGADAFNVYGPTEAAIWSTAQRAGHHDDPPLGAPLAGEAVYVLEPTGELAPIEVEGELCIGGVGVARGYVGQPALTAERFVPDPFAATPGARMYRTGDLARFDADGSLRFRGRRDGQIKIRGARLERAEVELALQEHPAVRRAAALVEPGGVLVAAVQWSDGRHAGADELRAFLGERLPAHAIPSVFREVAEMPMTERGKLDTRALAIAAPLGGGRPWTAPAGATEEALAEIWGTLLGPPRVGRYDDFFALGGHSLHAVALVSQVAQRLGRKLAVADVLRAGTLAALARAVDHAQAVTEPAAARRDQRELSPAQRRLWAFEQLHPGTATANISLAVRAHGPLDADKLTEAVDTLLERHAELRASFPAGADGRPERHITTHPAETAVAAVDPHEALSRLHTEIMRPFDIEHGPLHRLTVLRCAPDEHLLAFTVHHLVADVTAAGVLARELSALYRGGPLGEPRSFAEYVATRPPERDPAAEAWWRQTLAGAPRRAFAPAMPEAGAGVTEAALDAGQVRRYAREHGATPFMVTATVFAQVVARRAGVRELALGIDVSGREAPGAADVVGPLVNQIVLRLDTAAPDFAGALAHTRARLTDALAHAHVSYDRIVAAVAPDGPDRALFDVKLAYQPAIEEQLTLEGLTLTPVERTPVPPAEALVLFVREAEHDLRVELQYRDDIAAAMGVMREFLDTLRASVREPGSSSAPAGGFTRRKARTVERPAGDFDTTDPTSPPTLQAGAEADLRAWLTEHREGAAEALVTHGVLLFRGFGVREPGELQALVAAAGEAPYLSTEHTRASLGTHVFTPIPYSNRERLLWHNEDSFRAQWPAHLWFACARPADTGGETTVADSRTILAALGAAGERMAREGVMYVRRFGDGLGQSWEHVFGTADPAEVEARCAEQGIDAAWDGDRLVTRTILPVVFRHPRTGADCWVGQVLHFHPAALSDAARTSLSALYGDDALPRDCRHADGSPIPDDVVHALVERYEETERACRWEPGDVLVVDNVLVAHGRRPYTGERTLLVAMTGSLTHAAPALVDQES